jgi:hypothetical protein
MSSLLNSLIATWSVSDPNNCVNDTMVLKVLDGYESRLRLVSQLYTHQYSLPNRPPKSYSEKIVLAVMHLECRTIQKINLINVVCISIYTIIFLVPGGSRSIGQNEPLCSIKCLYLPSETIADFQGMELYVIT